MTNELEKQFFDTFGIEPKLPDYNEGYCDGCEIDDDKCESNCPHKARITPEILLELICILSQHYSWEEGNWFIERTTIDELKEWLLEVFIEIDKIGLSKIIKHQVRTLF